MPKGGIIGLLTAIGLTARFANGQLEPDCNPLQAECQPKKAWPKNDYYIDFTKQNGPPSDWTIANSEVVDFTSNGAEFSYAKKGDAPNMWTDFYMLGGRYDVEMKIAPGQGVISSATLWSDIQDEIDYEFSGNQFGQTPFPPQDGMWAVETNVFAQGKMWDGAATYQKDAYKPAEQFHKYSVEWDENHVDWYIDDKVIRSIQAKDTPSGFTFPQSPMKIQLGVWGGGDPSNNYWTTQWAGGQIDTKGAPYTMYVKSVNITNKYPACQYKYQDKTGKIGSIEKITDGCNSPARIVKDDYPVSSLDESSTATLPSSSPQTGYPTSDGFPTYDASSPSASHSSTLAQPSDSYPASPPASSHSSTSSAADYPTYQASSPEAVSSSAIVHPSISSVAESSSTSPAAGVSSASHSSLSSVESVSSTAKGYPSSSESVSAKESETVSSGYPVSPPASSGILSSLSSFILGSSSSSETKDTYPTASLTASGSIPASSISTGGGRVVTQTIYSTNIHTVTSCPPSVTNCPVGKVTTELVSVSTTVSSTTEAEGSQSIVSSSINSVGTPAQSSSSAKPVSESSSLSSTISESSPLSYPTSVTVSFSRTMPSTYSVSSEITTSIMSTVYSTNIVTVTSCPPSVTNCPVGQVTTETKSLYTTICPVTQTVLDGTTYGGTEAAKEASSTASIFTYSMSSFHPSSVESAASSSSTSLSYASSSVNSVGISSSVLSSSSGYLVVSSVSSVSSVGSSSSVSGSSSGYSVSSLVNSAASSSSILTSSVAASNASVPTSGSHSIGSLSTDSASSGPISSSATSLTTSTVYSTNIYTITSCAPDVTNCPAKLGQVTTDLVSLYTTICPVAESEATAHASSSALPVATGTSAPSPAISSYATLRNITASGRPLTTSTVYTSSIYTVSSCKPGEAECSSKIGSVTTETVPLYTTVCPVEETETALPVATTSSAVSVSASQSSATQVVSSYAISSASGSSVGSSTYQAASSNATYAQSHATPPSSYAASAVSYTTSTVYSTNIYTVTSCAPGVTNCPAKVSVTTEVVAVSTTVCPVADQSKGIPDASAPVATGGSQYSTTAITFSNTLSGSVIVVTSTISFIDTPAPTSHYPTQGPGTTNTAGTAAVSLSSYEVSPSITKPGTTITLGSYFTSFIEYDTITHQPPASVSSGTVPTSYYTASSATVDVPSYRMSELSSTVGVGPTSVPVAISAASSHPAASSQTVPGDLPKGSSYPQSPPSESDSTVTSSTTNTHTVTETRSPKQAATCPCDQPTVYVTVTAAQVTVTSTVQPPFPSSYPTGTAPAAVDADATNAYPTSSPGAIRRWLRRGHGHGGEHGHGHGH
ncbi:hypothetical protein F4804DRAFT_272531 [Jackrogersella minutella]|nr:hypothetical protein F4804DRAFT_272531 [Jackrogersella minutella]